MSNVYLEQVKTIQFEISSNCNAACPGCVRFIPVSVSGDPTWIEKNVFLDIDVFRKLIDDGVEMGVDRVEFCGTIDDPVMHPRFLEMLQHCVDHELVIRVHSNAGARKPEYWSEMAHILSPRSHKAQVNFSIDGLEDTNHLYRRNTNWDKIMANAQAFIDAGGHAVWQYLVFPWNEHQTKKAAGLAHVMGFQQFKSRHDRSDASKIDHDNFEESVKKLFPVTRNGVWQKYVDKLDEKSQDDEIRCHTQGENMIFVAHTGEVWPCCFLHNGNYRSAGLMPEYRRRFLDHYEEGWNNLYKHDIKTIMQHEFFQNDLVKSWENKKHGTGKFDRISRCTETCGKKVLKNRPIGQGKKVALKVNEDTPQIKQPTDSPTFCVLPWIHVNSSVAGKYRPCCNSNAAFSKRDDEMSFEEAFHSKEMYAIRQAMVNGEKPEACRVCWDREEQGAHSFRKTYNEYKFKEFINPNATQEIKYLDLRFDNGCNLGCRMCDPSSSNRVQDAVDWFHDREKQLPNHWKIFTGKRSDEYNQFLSNRRRKFVLESLPTLRVFKVTGGEPFMSQDFSDVLDAAIDSGDCEHIRLLITTNGTKFTNKILDKLEYFEGLDFNISVDGIGPTYDYIRWPFNWDKWHERMETLLEWADRKKYYQRNFVIRTSTLISAYNWLNVAELYKHLYSYTDKYPWLHDLDYVPKVDFNLGLRPEDSELSAKWLPDHILDEGLRRWEQTNNRQVEEIRTYVNTHRGRQDPEKHEQFMYITKALDEQRNQSYECLDPLLVKWMKKLDG